VRELLLEPGPEFPHQRLAAFLAHRDDVNLLEIVRELRQEIFAHVVVTPQCPFREPFDETNPPAHILAAPKTSRRDRLGPVGRGETRAGSDRTTASWECFLRAQPYRGALAPFRLGRIAAHLSPETPRRCACGSARSPNLRPIAPARTLLAPRPKNKRLPRTGRWSGSTWLTSIGVCRPSQANNVLASARTGFTPADRSCREAAGALTTPQPGAISWTQIAPVAHSAIGRVAKAGPGSESS
jgi:hypothetical protein